MSKQVQGQPMSIKEAERKAFRLSTSQDGLYDIFIGAYIALLSLTPWLDENGLRTPWNVLLAMVIGLLIFLGILFAKKILVAPRIGQVRYGIDRKRRMKRLAIGLMVIFLLTVILFGMTISAIYFREPTFNRTVSWSLPFDLVHTAAGVFISAIFSLIGYMNDYVRLYLYGFLFGLGYVISTTLQDITGNPFYWPWALAGLIVALIGLVLFIRFLREYPLPQETVFEMNG
jgi:MFS family permease